METLRYAVRVAILIAAGMYAAEYGIVEHVVWAPGAYATTVNGVSYAPGRYPGDGRSK